MPRRVRCLLVSKAFYEAGAHGSGMLWENVDCAPHNSGQMRKVLEWVWSRKADIRRLSLHSPGDIAQQAVMPLWGMMTAAFVSVRLGLVRYAAHGKPLQSW